MAGGKPEPPASGFQGGEPETRKTQPQPSPAELGSSPPAVPTPLFLASLWSPERQLRLLPGERRRWRRTDPISAGWPCSLTRP